MNTIELAAAIVAVVAFLKGLPKVGPFVTGYVTPVVAVVIGMLFAFVNHGSFLMGAMSGLVAVGGHVLVTNFAAKKAVV